MKQFSILISFMYLIAISQVVEAQVKREDREPEAATGRDQKQVVVTQKHMVVAANPLASKAGEKVLREGGSAIDAAIAVQAMLTLVEPQSSGIGGGSFILYWDNQKKQLITFDGRETAPQSVSADLFLQDGKPMKWRDALVGGRAVGVPGVLAALHKAHQQYGKVAWSELFDETIEKAEQGFVVSPRMAKLLGLDFHPGLKHFPTSKQYFYPNGSVLKAGDLRDNQPLAQALRHIAKDGPEYFYNGPIAQKIVEAVQTAPVNAGFLTTKDMASYQPVIRKPLCGEYRVYKVCGMAPPSSGGINIIQILRLLEPYELANYTINDPDFVHLFTQASRLAYADRKHWVADSDYTGLSPLPLIDETYLDARRALINFEKDTGRYQPGLPYGPLQAGLDAAPEVPNTSHISIVDRFGNAVSMTSSVEFAFGSGLMVDGFMLNNQLTDFSLNPNIDGKPALNRVEAGKRPRSSMSPTMIFDKQNNLKMVIGSPGGSSIVSYVAQTIIGVLDWQLDMQQAISMPRVRNRNDYTALEKGTKAEALKDTLQERGHKVKLVDLNSGLHGIWIEDGKLSGGADPRREGLAVGQ